MAAAHPFDLTSFDPSPERAAAIGARMQARLGDSLRYILGQAEGRISIPRPAVEAFLVRLAQGPVSPLVFGAYCDLVLACDAGALDEAERLLGEIAVSPNLPAGLHVVALGDPEADAAADRYRRLADTDPEMPLTVAPAPAEDVRKARSLIDRAMALLDRGNPALADELRVLLREIVLAAGSGDPQAMQFDGVSSFMLWGAVILNVRAYSTVLDMVQGLAHESGHNLLFGLCADGPLQENDDRELYSSPLRTDPRPMDGIFHATYVSARTHQALQRLLDAGVLDEEQSDEARRANLANARHFAQGLEIVDRHAKLTKLGRAVRDGTAGYMAGYL